MSIRVDKRSLTPEVKKQLLELLSIKSKGNYLGEAPTTIIMALLDGDYFHVPYFFGRKFFTRPLNVARHPVDITCRVSLRPSQAPIIEEALKQLVQHGTTHIVAPPGEGKTVLGTTLIAKLGEKALIVLPRKALIPQWASVLSSLFIAKVSIVPTGHVTDMMQFEMSLADVIITTARRFVKIRSSTVDAIGTVVLDESHMLCVAEALPCLLRPTPRYLVACTATPNRKDGLYNMIRCLTGLHEARGGTHPMMTVIKINTGIEHPVKRRRDGGLDYTALLTSQLMNEERNLLILDICRRFVTSEERAFIVTRRIDHGNVLKETLRLEGRSVDRFMQDDDSFEDCDILIGTDQKMGTGFDEASYRREGGAVASRVAKAKKAKAPGGSQAPAPGSGATPREFIPRRIMIIAHSINNREGVEQVTGRVYRHSRPVIFDPVDANGVFQNHWHHTREPYYRQKNAHIIEIEASDLESLTIP
jgi:hypothetical protein